MLPVERAIFDAWLRVAPRLATDAAELGRRLARRRGRLLARPPRAWCVALRANDRRLERWGIQRRARAGEDGAEEVILDAPMLRRLCAPVFLTPPGQTLEEVAAKLGCTRRALHGPRCDGVFEQHYVEGLEGRWGRPRALLYTDQPLDPATRMFVAADAAWTWTARGIVERIPDALGPQTLVRVPVSQPRGGKWANVDGDSLHPEHPANDRPAPTKTYPKRLSPPPPDSVAYKWKDGEYLGYDWRNPVAQGNYERRQRRLAQRRAAIKRRRQEKRRPRLDAGSLEPRGWRWQCAHCGRLVNVLYMPVERVNLVHEAPRCCPAAAAGLPTLESLVGDAPVPPPAIEGFACGRCHRVHRSSPANLRYAWNEIVTYLSGGLLYGREVERPAGFLARHRRVAYGPRPTREPSKRRPQVEAMLLAGRTYRQIADKLGIDYHTAHWHGQQVFKQHGVRRLAELLRRHGRTPTPKKYEQVYRRFVAGQKVAQISREMGISAAAVYWHLRVLRRAGRIAAGRINARPCRERISSVQVE